MSFGKYHIHGCALLSLWIVPRSAINGNTFQEPALPVSQHRLPFPVVLLVDTDLYDDKNRLSGLDASGARL